MIRSNKDSFDFIGASEMWSNAMHALASLILVTQSATVTEDRATLTWGAIWPTGHHQNDSIELIVLGARRSIPMNIVAWNSGNVPIQVIVPARALAVDISMDDQSVSGRLTCEEVVAIQRMGQSSTLASEGGGSEEITLFPEDSIESKCQVAQEDGRRFTPGHYRIWASARGWPRAAYPKTSWEIEVRDPSTSSDRRLLHFTEGNELFLRQDYTVAAKEFELARSADPGDVLTTMALARTYERLTRYSEAAALLEGLLPLAQQHKLDEALARVLPRELAINYVAGGREEQAARLLLQNGFTADQAKRFIASARTSHMNPR